MLYDFQKYFLWANKAAVYWIEYNDDSYARAHTSTVYAEPFM